MKTIYHHIQGKQESKCYNNFLAIDYYYFVISDYISRKVNIPLLVMRSHNLNSMYSNFRLIKYNALQQYKENL
jgi:hypothetical protein